MKLVAILCLVAVLVAAFGCGSDVHYPLILPVDVKHETREFSTPVDEGGEGDTIAKDGLFLIEGSVGFLLYLEYIPDRNEFQGVAAGYYVRAESITIEVWLSNGVKLEPETMTKLGKGTDSGVVPFAFDAPDAPFESWQAQVEYVQRRY